MRTVERRSLSSEEVVSGKCGSVFAQNAEVCENGRRRGGDDEEGCN